MRLFLPSLALLSLSACVTASPPDSITERPTGGECNAAAVQNHVGHAATTTMGEAILTESGARRLRWGAPDSAWTMDYRTDRVNVRYDESLTITAITCG
ncbi:I78 family peptidase inhibitor [Parerythrobacter lacustris]|uniref:I78 family peptidase inhibitor n=1 Tax=Parerythrobacter lacustris TaxID=2969984 RepID=A0ABT1XQV5_9SPHN|nr:I78 family peptidase inhibitor [Parerythrobacter lacustris]MCR2832832.1 I78 family peptidase inhibitor [Parerythrobacter lacustris]